jgi:hypothetical protein
VRSAEKTPPLNLAAISQVRIEFDGEHLPSNVIVELRDGRSIVVDGLYRYEPKPFPGSPSYEAFEAIFGQGKELRVQTWLAQQGGAR